MARRKAQAVKRNSGIPTAPKKRKSRSVAVKSTTLNTKCKEDLLIGKISLGTTLTYLPEKWLKCKVSFLCVSDEVDRIHLEFDEVSVIVTLIIDTQLSKEIFTANVFSFQFPSEGQDLFMNVYFRESPLLKFNTKIGNALKTVFEITHKISLSAKECPMIVFEDDESEEKLYGVQEIDQLYKLLSSQRSNPETFDCSDVQHSSLKPILRPYQINAVKWMIHKERNIEADQETVHPLYLPSKIASSKELYYDKFSGHITPIKPCVSCNSKGGILAEEMGLGKTVEFLALILNNPYSSDKKFDEENSEFLVQSEDSEELSDCDNADVPIFKKQTKKKSHGKRTKLTSKEDKKVEYQAKDIQVPADWVKSTKNKSQNWVALQLWYNSALSEVNHKRKKPEIKINCICGETYKSGQEMCVDCGKFQHKDCLGYEKRFGKFRCPSCWLDHPSVESGATLIVTPISLRTQWCNEIKMHIDKKSRVLVYEGSHKTPVYPTYFKHFDIVITTYSVLQAEFRLTEKREICELRRKRKYDFQGSPSSRIKWWRLCLDEAQTVETPGRIVSEMAKKLTAQFRWAVTGTPISKDIKDLFGMVDYLQIEPYNEPDTWKNVLYTPYFNGNVEPLCSFLSKVMWRTTKAEVIDQIGLPKQIIKEHFLEFSAVEKFFYNKEHELCSEAFIAILKNIDTNIPLVKLDKSLSKKIMVPLLSLRQVCTHPNAERGKYLATKKQVSTMKELSEALILKNTNESEELLRVLVSSLNGLAGIYLLMQNPVQAAEEYRKVMQLSARFSEEKTENNLSVDKSQSIHTMHNLADLLDVNSGIPPTLHDAMLREDCRILEQKYIQKFIHNTSAAYQESANTQSAILKLEDQFTLKEGQWFSDGFDWVSIEDSSDESRNRIQTNHDTAHIKCPIDLGSHQRIFYFVATWNDEVADYREELAKTINSLFTYKENEEYKIIIDQKSVEKATDCHLRPEEKHTGKKKKCPLCTAEDFIKKFESKIFQMTKRTVTFEDMSLQGTWKSTSQEIISKSLYNLLKVKNAASELLKDGEIYLNLLDNLKKEFKETRKLWTHIYQQVAAQDELNMCKIKLRLEDPSKKKKDSKDNASKRLSYIVENKSDTSYMLNEHELDYHMMILKSDARTSSDKLEKNLGVRSYSKTLKKQQYEGSSPDSCPICTNTSDQHWGILPCGHNYCMECLHNLIQKNGGGSKITCCFCRQSIVIEDISYTRSATVKSETSNFNIKGNFSTKIEAVIKLILDSREEDEDVKVLVFSSWSTVLKSMKEASTTNDIKNEILLPFKSEERIEHFKDEKEKITALLSPINLGGKGLNLIEATHVILMEPLSNPGEELQAVGRVHRIGQTKQTFVHKLCIKNTIEESILTATSKDADKWDRNKVTLEQLKRLFEKAETCERSASEDNDNANVENNMSEAGSENVVLETNSHPE